MFDEDFIKTTLTPILAIAGAVLGLIGTGLGILNWCLARRTHQVKLRTEMVLVSHTDPSIDETDNKLDRISHIVLHIRCFNDSYFDVSVNELGLQLYKWGKLRSTFQRLSGAPNDERIPSRSSKTYTLNAVLAGNQKSTALFDLACRPDRVLSKKCRGAYFKTTTGDAGVSQSKQPPTKICEILEEWAIYHLSVCGDEPVS